MPRKERSYGFLTTGGFLYDVKAKSASSAHSKAKKSQFNKMAGEITDKYLTYGRSGFAPTGVYKTLKKRK